MSSNDNKIHKNYTKNNKNNMNTKSISIINENIKNIVDQGRNKKLIYNKSYINYNNISHNRIPNQKENNSTLNKYCKINNIYE